MILLDHTGKPQMYMQGGEVVFSRPSTKQIIKLALQDSNEEGLLRLGEAVYKERKRQLKREKS